MDLKIKNSVWKKVFYVVVAIELIRFFSIIIGSYKFDLSYVPVIVICFVLLFYIISVILEIKITKKEDCYFSLLVFIFKVLNIFIYYICLCFLYFSLVNVENITYFFFFLPISYVVVTVVISISAYLVWDIYNYTFKTEKYYADKIYLSDYKNEASNLNTEQVKELENPKNFLEYIYVNDENSYKILNFFSTSILIIIYFVCINYNILIKSSVIKKDIFLNYDLMINTCNLLLILLVVFRYFNLNKIVIKIIAVMIYLISSDNQLKKLVLLTMDIFTKGINTMKKATLK